MNIGTMIYTWLNGRQVGIDEFGNRYFEANNGAMLHNRPRRWCMFKGDAEASMVPPEWHAWLADCCEGERVAPPAMGAPEAGYPTLEAAPGTYVHMA